MMVIYIKQHLSNIWSSIHEKVKQHWGWTEKSVAYKKACNSQNISVTSLKKSYQYTLTRGEVELAKLHAFRTLRASFAPLTHAPLNVIKFLLKDNSRMF